MTDGIKCIPEILLSFHFRLIFFIRCLDLQAHASSCGSGRLLCLPETRMRRAGTRTALTVAQGVGMDNSVQVYVLKLCYF